MAKIEMRDSQHGHFKHGYGYGDHLRFGGNFLDSHATPSAYPPQCKQCKQQHESTHWREDIGKVLCDTCYVKETEDGQEES